MTVPTTKRTFSALDHVLYGISWSAFVAVTAIAAWLHPSPTGRGTHTQLGLPPCGFYTVFHKPCPSCGMTTCFAYIMHGHPVEAFYTQPAGFFVFLAMLIAWLYLPVAWRKRKPFDHFFELNVFLPTVLGLIILILGVWVWRLR